ncbi:uncharacterized protein LOC129595589 isoform X1 [Paramacrobiotus metropolitanus]|uniref:uncharacterized protein LOC129595589 isoform X1 n=1 Tax=Paramacrobiotus metropolitanus TaxID=2943436 RepID=UPI0024458259|nr:uncharacterized protein LOC129595589 isoform X1 [Paramacrobiotus metropolitanus]
MNRHLLRCQLALYRASNSTFTAPASSPRSISTTAPVLKAKKKDLTAIKARRPPPPMIPHPTAKEMSTNPPDPRNEPGFDWEAYSKKFNFRTGQHTGAGPTNVDKKHTEKPAHERVLSTGGISNAADKIKPDDSKDEDDGSLETKEDLSPGTANKQELAKHAKKSHIPPEIAGKVHDSTAEFIHKQSGASSMGSGG